MRSSTTAPTCSATGSQNSTVAGRYIFPIRAGGGGGAVAGTVTDNATPSHTVGGAWSQCAAQARTSRAASWATRDRRHLRRPRRAHRQLRRYRVPAVEQWPGPGHVAYLHSDRPGHDHCELRSCTGPTPPPNGTTVTSGFGSTVIGGEQVPVINWDETSPITTHACPAGR